MSRTDGKLFKELELEDAKSLKLYQELSDNLLALDYVMRYHFVNKNNYAERQTFFYNLEGQLKQLYSAVVPTETVENPLVPQPQLDCGGLCPGEICTLCYQRRPSKR